ncbi:MAG: SCP2 sterol-binding domain-containing protein [Deltaproteobacteria bacterium]|nr:SCP2 sterol-binding domain-containing protein [Deltaproteobacteria bacterium]
MEEKFVYLSQAWRDEGEKRLKESLSPEKMNHATSSMTNLYKNCPDGIDRFLYFRFSNGEIAEMIVGEGEPPTKAEFRITGDYETFARITRGEIGAQKALMTLKLKLRGNMVKALRLASLADRLNKVLSTIPTQY